MMKQQKLILVDNTNSPSAEVHANYYAHPPPSQSQPSLKKKRNLPGNPDPEAEVISLSPTTLMATNRFVCEICNKGFQRDQNLQLHRRGHNLPWKLKQRNKNEIVRKKVYVCPEVNCVHHDPSRALGDLTGIKKHFSRKHGEKKWKCDKCSKRYAVQSDWKAHYKTCGTREYKCDCGTLFSRRDSFITHRAFCDALAEESARAITGIDPLNPGQIPTHFNDHTHLLDPLHQATSFLKKEQHHHLFPSWLQTQSQDQDCSPTSTSTSGPTLIAYHPAAPSAYMSATALLQKAAQMGTSHLSRGGTSIQAQCTTSSSRPQHLHQQYQNNQNSASTNGSSSSVNLFSSFFDNHHEMISMASFGNKDGGVGGACADGFADVSTFEDAFSQILDAKKEYENDYDHGNLDDTHPTSSSEPHHHIMMQDNKNGNIGSTGVMGNEGMTRDFLGLKAPSLNQGMKGSTIN
ncbi:protein indeterminate-domain 12-like isoform X2 [Rutidosis leptorrhynchoides]|uniref:protein indeterminate-domain 12-like isoform X2 n=1 Tax=Rutidosis leptorrhynchoides TaxID=125765 RepID=UPI003A997F75